MNFSENYTASAVDKNKQVELLTRNYEIAWRQL